jgi:small conductance mechanosensitive channel
MKDGLSRFSPVSARVSINNMLPPPPRGSYGSVVRNWTRRSQGGTVMDQADHHLGFLRELTWNHILLIAAVLIVCRLLVLAMRRVVRNVAERAQSHRRLLIWRMAPLFRLLIWLGGIAIIIRLLVEPTVENVVALVATVGLALAFALKDYVSCLIAGIVVIIENTYQPGDWIEIDGTYGEVTAIGTRAVHIVTADDTEVIIPHAKLWSSSVSNASSGNHSLLCVTNFYLHADHDGVAVRQALAEIGEASSYRKADSPVKVVAAEMAWGTRYKIKAYVADSREQFAMMTDLTVCGKERLRSMNIVFAHTPYAEVQKR